MEHHGGLNPEACAHDHTTAEGLTAPSDNVLGRGTLKLGVQRIQVEIGRGDSDGHKQI